MLARQQAKALLKKRGWSYRSAAETLGLSPKNGFVHLCRVLNGERTSHRLLRAIQNIPDRSKR